CTFCNVEKNPPDPVDSLEPIHVAQAVTELGLKHVVITSVTRDDLSDGGAGHFAQVVGMIKKYNSSVTIEVLIPDFKGDPDALKTVIDADPDIINHNVETVSRLYPEVRPMAVYKRSLELLGRVKSIKSGIFTKSGIMLGLGETEDEVLKVFDDLRKEKCDFLTIGQYLAPSKLHHPVVEYIRPEIFDNYRSKALEAGFSHVASGPFVRSSYHAQQALEQK
ncbi:MAG: lipoyl synthase, partial [Eubacteriales bacterium]|nr:lipoyl synthase [Eubacteriales bacterium]